MGNFTSTVLSKVRVNDEAVEPNENPTKIGQKDYHELNHENLKPGDRRDLLEKIIERWETFKIKQALFDYKK